jgi:hypothetical protein
MPRTQLKETQRVLGKLHLEERLDKVGTLLKKLHVLLHAAKKAPAQPEPFVDPGDYASLTQPDAKCHSGSAGPPPRDRDTYMLLEWHFC